VIQCRSVLHSPRDQRDIGAYFMAESKLTDEYKSCDDDNDELIMN